jgi:two-component sensor histidine kinase
MPQGSFDGRLSSFCRDLSEEDAQRVWQLIMLSVNSGAPYRAVYRAAGVGWAGGRVGIATVGIGAHSQAGLTLQCDGPVVVRDLATDTRFDGPPLLHKDGVRSGVSVTIPGNGGAHSESLASTREISVRFDRYDVDLLVSMAHVVANAARQDQFLQRQRSLMREMAHRDGNPMQLVASIARQTLAIDQDPEYALSSFFSRQDMLARANSSIAEVGWSKTRLRLMVEEALKKALNESKWRGKMRIIVSPKYEF